MTEIESAKALEYQEKLDPKEAFKNAPKKVSAPILAVVENNVLLGEVLGNVWVNQPETHAHFVGGALFITTCGYNLAQLRDVVKMRYSTNTPINLTWSPKRWIHEHEMGQRKVTAQRLSEQKITYQNELLEQSLTEFGKKCIVRTSHDLGNHGLEMRHCIASYHDSIVRCGGMVLRVEHETDIYTAWVFLSSLKGECKPNMGQLKGVQNASPFPHVRAEICEQIGAENNRIETKHGESTQRDNVPEYMRTREFYEQLQTCLQKHEEFSSNRIKTIVWEFRGGGDSGQLEEIHFVLDDGKRLVANSWQNQQAYDNYETTGYRVHDGSSNQHSTHMRFGWPFFSDTSDLSNYSHWDWYNNDGGGVDIELDVESLEMDIGGYYNYSDSESCAGPTLNLVEDGGENK